ncbi:hypothetical protein D9M71_176370 [compost metagenome]
MSPHCTISDRFFMSCRATGAAVFMNGYQRRFGLYRNNQANAGKGPRQPVITEPPHSWSAAGSFFRRKRWPEIYPIQVNFPTFGVWSIHSNVPFSIQKPGRPARTARKKCRLGPAGAVLASIRARPCSVHKFQTLCSEGWNRKSLPSIAVISRA